MIRNLRWYIVALLTLVTTINYLDRQALSVAQVVLEKELGITDAQYGDIVAAFLVAYGVFHPLAGRVVDRIGSRMGLTLAFIWWSLASVGHAFASGARSFAAARFLLGVGEAGNFPAAIKTVGEWFPAKERALATGILNVGTGVGAMLAPPVVGAIIYYLDWRAAFLLTGAIGGLWLIPWLLLARKPEKHPLITPEELAYIRAGQVDQPVEAAETPKRGVWREALGTRQLWALMAARLLSDPVWLFFSFWIPKYFKAERGFDLKDIALFVWLPFLAADFGSIAGGWFSSFLIGRGWPVLKARKTALCCSASLMPVAILSVYVESWQAAIACISVAAFAHQSWSASTLTLPSDIFPKRMVATCYGCAAMMGVMGGAVTQSIVGRLIETFGYTPVFTVAGCLHPIGALTVVLVVKAAWSDKSGQASPPELLHDDDRSSDTLVSPAASDRSA
ncbi:MAG TPA: MFS transporter [Phycisphaerae bacterium]|nr:MFS transporter [Phycisphaerae bacterium]HOJ74180.1 MFS transporter [Phycisphaerae bacterium]HOM51258.1 MFS transporter [Phycisphaerae bacterium]HOQ87156.1 MFS transporter [Phycisphaerae bacterium]HPP26777.1 MFS transporter [Phycisphaerae bacterium]